MNNSEAHSKLVNQVLLEIGKRFPNVRAWKNHTGQAYTPDSTKRAINLVNQTGDAEQAIRTLIPIKFGVVGQADISGIICPNGRRLEIEVKTGTGRLSDVQKNYRKMITDMGGLHIELRKISDLDIINQIEFVQ